LISNTIPVSLGPAYRMKIDVRTGCWLGERATDLATGHAGA